MSLMKRKGSLSAGKGIPEHEFNERGFCIHCGVVKTFIERTEQPCLSQRPRAERRAEIKRRNERREDE